MQMPNRINEVSFPVPEKMDPIEKMLIIGGAFLIVSNRTVSQICTTIFR